jgi:hypothetical protein
MTEVPARPNVVARIFWRGLSAMLRLFPFTITDVVRTRTIGNLDPMRSPFGDLFGDENSPATWYGTTHELVINFHKKAAAGEDIYAPILARYEDAASPDKSECAVVDGWLTTARDRGKFGRSGEGRVNWDSGYSSQTKVSGKVVPGDPENLTKIRPRPDNPDQHVESQIR